jgi:hypothetical protein
MGTSTLFFSFGRALDWRMGLDAILLLVHNDLGQAFPLSGHQVQSEWWRCHQGDFLSANLWSTWEFLVPRLLCRHVSILFMSLSALSSFKWVVEHLKISHVNLDFLCLSGHLKFSDCAESYSCLFQQRRHWGTLVGHHTHLSPGPRQCHCDASSIFPDVCPLVKGIEVPFYAFLQRENKTAQRSFFLPLQQHLCLS